jgi:hypothetical protein
LPSAPPVAVLLSAVHVQQDSNTLMYVFDADVVSIDSVQPEQFECTVGGSPLGGNSIDFFSGAEIIVNFGTDVSGASDGTLVSGAGIVFDNGGVAADGQTQPVTP